MGIPLNLFSVSNKTQQLGSGEDINKKSIVKIVSPVQQVAEQAKEEIKRESADRPSIKNHAKYLLFSQT